MFRLELLPASEGDALILSWGAEATPRRILIDAGRAAAAAAIQAYAAGHALGPGAFELFIISHIDRDHIGGAVPLLRDKAFCALVKEVWFNGRADLEYPVPGSAMEAFGALDGERVSEALRLARLPWNVRLAGQPVAIIDDELPCFGFPDGMTLTIVSPDRAQLAALAQPWDDAVEAAQPGWETLGDESPVALEKLAQSQFTPDRSKPNGSSIAVIAEYDGRRVLLAADAHVARLMKSLSLFGAGDPGRSKMALVKASHHGSRGNISEDFVRAVGSAHWAFSTNGRSSNHPDAEAVARAIWYSPGTPTLWFNYRTKQNELWTRTTVPQKSFTAIFGENGYLTIDVPAMVTG